MKRPLRTIHALESTARRHVDIVAVRAVELDGIDPRHVGPPARHDIGGYAVNTGARSKYAILVFLRLEARAVAECCSPRLMPGG